MEPGRPPSRSSKFAFWLVRGQVWGCVGIAAATEARAATANVDFILSVCGEVLMKEVVKKEVWR